MLGSSPGAGRAETSAMSAVIDRVVRKFMMRSCTGLVVLDWFEMKLDNAVTISSMTWNKCKTADDDLFKYFSHTSSMWRAVKGSIHHSRNPIHGTDSSNIENVDLISR